MNWTLRDFLDDFVSAYLDDIIIFTDGSLSDHHAHVRTILNCLQETGLHLELKKCEFDVTRTKYLGFIVEARKGTLIDPDKVKAIQE